MSENCALICASHAPLALEIGLDETGQTQFSRILAGLGKKVRDYSPDLIIFFGPDHFNGFFYDAMPSFCIGTSAEGVGDWGTSSERWQVPADTALSLVEAVREAEIDVALSHRMKIDHGFTQIIEMMIGANDFSTIPVMINCAASPLPHMRRVRLLGEAIGQAAVKFGSRLLFVGSGGLSHDPPIPQFHSSTGEQRELLLAGRHLSSAERKHREDRVRVAAAAGHGVNTLPPNSRFDREVLSLIAAGETKQFDGWTEQMIKAEGGGGGNEIRTWVAATAAFLSASAASGRERLSIETAYYEVVEPWITGMAVIHSSNL